MRKNLVGPALKYIRKLQKPKLTQLELLSRLEAYGVFLDATAISKIEAGTRPVTDIELYALCKALGVSVNKLLPLD